MSASMQSPKLPDSSASPEARRRLVLMRGYYALWPRSERKAAVLDAYERGLLSHADVEALTATLPMDDPMDDVPGLYTLTEIMDRAEARERPFWTCPTTGQDCRAVPTPALAVIRSQDGKRAGCRFQMYSTPSLAEEASYQIVECVHGMTAFYLLDCWLHIGGKRWVDPVGMAEAMNHIAWHFGDRSWSFAKASGPRSRGCPPVVHRPYAVEDAGEAGGRG